MEIYRSDITYFSSTKQLPYFSPMRRISIIKCNSTMFSGSFFRIQNCLYFLFINGHWFFCDNVCTKFHSTDYELMMCTIHCCNDQHLRLCFFHHLFKIRVCRARYPDHSFSCFYTSFIDIAKSNEFNITGIIPH